MKLVERFDSLPKGRPNWETFAQTSAGELRPLGQTPRLTMGQRLLGRYSDFYQVDMTQKMTSTRFEARSATGRHSFTIRIEVDFRVADGAALVSGQADVDQFLVTPMKRIAASEAGFAEGQDYHQLELKLIDRLDPGRVGDVRHGPFEVIGVAVSVDPPKGIKLDSEAMETTRSLQLRAAEALASGDVQAANSIQSAMDFIEEQQHRKAHTVLRRADFVSEVEAKIRELTETGTPRDSVAVRALRQQIESYVTDGRSDDRIEDNSDDSEDDPDETPPRDVN